MPTNLATLFSTLFMWELKFKCESTKISNYFALSHDNIDKLLMNKVKWGLRIRVVSIYFQLFIFHLQVNV